MLNKIVIYNLYKFPRNHLYRDDSEPNNYNRTCSETLNDSIKIYIKIITFQGLSFAIAVAGVFYSLIHDGNQDHVTLCAFAIFQSKSKSGILHKFHMGKHRIGGCICGLFCH